MGSYVNPNNDEFSSVVRKEPFVDKTGMIRFTNRLIDESNSRICVTRPRRFGKTIALNMLTAYYSRGCDSRELFQDLNIAQDPSFLRHLNQHYVIRLDVYNIWNEESVQETTRDLVSRIQAKVINELIPLFPDAVDPTETSLIEAIRCIHNREGVCFVFLIDEWDVVFRRPNTSSQLKVRYLSLLTGLFKGADIEACSSLVYMTGILPPIKYLQGTDSQSALNNFEEFSMLTPDDLSEYVGFTEQEVRSLCLQYSMPFDQIREWYDGYHLDKVGSIYCPESVYYAMRRKKIRGYWIGTSGVETVRENLRIGLPGMKEAVDSLLAGECVPINPISFRNNLNAIECMDDVLTLLVHYGYLAFDEDSKTVRIPNREVKDEFTLAIQTSEWGALRKIVTQSLQLLRDTWAGNEDAVAHTVEEVHEYKCGNFQYNTEEDLRGVINLAYYAADAYYTIFPELTAGRGFADIAMLPRPTSSALPMILELKWDQTAETALTQIKARNYTGRLKNYPRVLLVGISYEKDRDSENYKKHTCSITMWENSTV